jgi:cyanophycinase
MRMASQFSGLLLLLSCAGNQGTLVLAGGGKLPDSLFRQSLAACGTDSPIVLVFPQASSREKAGSEGTHAWTAAGALGVSIADLSNPDTVASQILAADILWFSGGSQLKLIKELDDAHLVHAIKRRHHQGAIVGGTSAGAAAMGKIVISGEPSPGPFTRGAMEAHEGLGLCPGLIIDQHFTQRNRNHRLLTAVMDNPRHVGVGISEGTIFRVRGRQGEVLGAGPVHIYDARKAKIMGSGPRQSAERIQLSILQAGESYSW